MIVADTNTVAYLYLEGDHTLLAEKVLTKDAVWMVPRLWRSEFRNVLALYLKKKIIALEDALKIAQKAERFLTPNEKEVPTSYVLKLAQAKSCSAYDAEFVALAQYLEVPLVTSDRQILQLFPDTAVSLSAFTV